MLRAYLPLSFSTCLFAFATLCAPEPAVAAESGVAAAEAGPEDGVLVLNDGGVLRGDLTREGDHYVVIGAKSRLEVAAANVALACSSLAAAYDEQQRQLPHDTSEAHLGLADWCLRYDLLPQAGRELADARRLDPHNSQLDLLQRRLVVATQAASPRKAVDDKAADAKQQSAAETARLEAIVAELPAGAVERFTRKVQPLLVNNCTTAGCHQVAGKQVFQLDRAVLHGLSNRRTTLGNLVATLALVNRDAPQLSPLLTIPRAEHAGIKQPIMGSRQDQQFRQLEEWLAVVTGTPIPEEERTDAMKTTADAGAKRGTVANRRGKATLNKTARSEPQPFHLDSEQTTKPIEARVPIEASGAAQPNTRPTGTATQAIYDEPMPFQQLQQRKRPTAQLKTWQPKDAFDPEIFNRQKPQAVSASPDSERRGQPASDH